MTCWQELDGRITWHGGAAGAMEERGGEDEGSNFVNIALISSFDTCEPGIGGQEKEGPCTIFRPGGRQESKHCLQNWQVPVVSLSLFYFEVFFVFLFILCVQYLIRILLNRKCSCS